MYVCVCIKHQVLPSNNLYTNFFSSSLSPFFTLINGTAVKLTVHWPINHWDILQLLLIYIIMQLVLRIFASPSKRNGFYCILSGGKKMEKEMATYSSILAWRIPWTEEPDRLQSMESQSDTTEWLTLTYFTENRLTIIAISDTVKIPIKYPYTKVFQSSIYLIRKLVIFLLCPLTCSVPVVRAI